MHAAPRDWLIRHLPPTYRHVLEIGSLDINGGVRDLLDPKVPYLGIDVQSGPGVDLVLDFIGYRHPHGVDLILCLEVLEHTPHWHEILASAARNLSAGGSFIGTCAAPGRPPHSARSEAPIGDDEWYGNISERSLKAELEKHFEFTQTNLAGVDLRWVAMFSIQGEK